MFFRRREGVLVAFASIKFHCRGQYCIALQFNSLQIVADMFALSCLCDILFLTFAEARGAMSLVETIFDLLFILDIFINFRTAYVDEVTGALVTDSGDVAMVS